MGSGAVSLSIPAATFAGPAITAIVVIAGQPVEVVWDRQASGPPAPSNDADADGLPDDWERSVGLDPTSGAGDSGPDGDPDHDGRANRDELAAGTHPKGVFKRYLAEGAFNVPVATFFPESAGKRFGAIVESLGPAPADIVVERAMYTSALSTPWAAATNALATRL